MPVDSFSDLKTFAKGAVVAQAGEASPRELVILLRGTVGVYQNYGLTNEAQTAVLGQGSFYGEYNLFLNRPLSETLVALTEVILLKVNRRNMAEFFSGQPDMTFSIFEGICKKLEDAGAQLEKYRRSEVDQSRSQKSAFFPEGHGSYLLPLENDNDHMLYLRKFTCPLCDHAFESLSYIMTRLRTEKVEDDLRVRYKDFEPMYYEVVTCPNCFYSASFDSFEEASRGLAGMVNERVGPYKLELEIREGAQRDTFTVFAGYYLALLCAPLAFDKHQLITGNLWLKLGRLYQDCGDEAMYRYASEKALGELRYAYENLDTNERSTQRLCYLLGDLYFRKEDLDNARTFFHMAKRNKAGVNTLRLQADNRLEEIRAIKKAQREKQEA